MAQDLNNLLTKIKRHGVRKSFLLAMRAIKRTTNSAYWRYQVMKKGTALRCPFFVVSMFKNRESFFIHNQKDIIQEAGLFVQRKFSFLGAQFTFDFDDYWCWHTDYRLKNSVPDKNCTFDCDSFCHDIAITCSGKDEHDVGKDIKIPWELSRLQFLVVLAQAYQLTGDQNYYDSCQDYIISWHEHNPFMRGVNWVGPMEVALRAINLIWTYQLFFEKLYADDRLQLFLHQMIYEHMTYLENHWELYDGRTNNHYLSDLVGYLYCICFFKSIDFYKQQIPYYFDVFCSELEKQILPDGSLYEGSSAYHVFVCQLCEHVLFLSRECGYQLPDSFDHKYRAMQNFCCACMSEAGLVTIGDDDSGFVIHGDSFIQKLPKFFGEKYFKNFGLSVYADKKMHMTLRHYQYTKRQPSGHFHQDALSITLVHNGVALFVDPGSYVYTASLYKRNYFRSSSSHSTISITSQNCGTTSPGSEPFFLEMHEHHSCDELFCARYKQGSVSLVRKVSFFNKKHICITDTLEQYTLGTPENKLYSVQWSFICGPDISVVYSEGRYILTKCGKDYAYITGDVSLNICSCWISRGYGVKEKSCCLRAMYDTTVTKKEFSFFIELL